MANSSSHFKTVGCQQVTRFSCQIYQFVYNDGGAFQPAVISQRLGRKVVLLTNLDARLCDHPDTQSILAFLHKISSL